MDRQAMYEKGKKKKEGSRGVGASMMRYDKDSDLRCASSLCGW